MVKSKREKELESTIRMQRTCSSLYHDELIKTKKGFDIVFRECLTPGQISDLLAELYELRHQRDEEFGPDTREWLDAFKELNNLSTDKEAIKQLISNYKAWNTNLGKNMNKFLKDFNKQNK